MSGSNKASVASTSTVKICAVCQDNATGMHFGAITCEGCKGFFRRSIKRNANFKCTFENRCDLTKGKRIHCQACRFNACRMAGMNSSLVLSDEEVNKKRELIKTNREKRLEQQRLKKNVQEQESLKRLASIKKGESEIEMSMNQKTLLENLLKGHEESYDFEYEEFETFRGKEKIPTPDDVEGSGTNSLAWLVASLAKQNPKPNKANSSENIATSSRTVESLQPKENPDTSTVSEAKVVHSEVFSCLHGTTDMAEPSSELSNATKSNDSSASSNLCNITSNTNYVNPQTSSGSSPLEENADSLSYLRGLLRSQGFSLSILEDSNSRQLLQHFCDIMTWGIKKVIDFCKSIPQFRELSDVDKILLLRGGCLEMLVLRSYFAFSSDDNKYMSNKFQYRPSDFLKAGASKEFVEKYNNLHLRMRKMELCVEEICLLLALVLFSSDRAGIGNHVAVENAQHEVAETLYAYEHIHKPAAEARTAYCELLLILPVLRTINMLFSSNIMTLQETNESDMNPLILEINNPANSDDD